MDFSPAWPHGPIEEVLENIFMVVGTNIIFHDDKRLQTSRNMIIIKQGRELTLINTVRLDNGELDKLDGLGEVVNIIRLGAFHGRDDAFFQQRYNASLWAIPAMELSHGEHIDFDLTMTTLPFESAQLISFTSTKFPEALILLPQEGGVLISCDSIKNWQKDDQFFDDATRVLMQTVGSIGEAVIDQTWLAAMNPSLTELDQLLSLDFIHLLSAHGPPLFGNAKTALTKSLQILHESARVKSL